MASEAGTASGSGSFSDFWQRTGKKFKFVPSNRKGSGGEGEQGGNDDQEDVATAALSAKQKRRAQVRKAQKEHRERKANYAKHLEQDIIELRNLISTAESEALQTQQENNAVKNALLQAQIPISQSLQNTQPSNLGQPFTFDPQGPLEPPPLNLSPDSLNLQDDMQWVPDDGSMKVSTFFDEDLRKTILRVSPKEDKSKAGEGQGIDMAGFDAFLDNVLKEIDSEGDSFSQATKQSLGPRETRPPATKPVKKEADFSTIAVNFILALEHPCRTHFHAPEPYFDPLGDPSGHELLASTLLYNSAPPPVFPALTAAVPVPSFTHPSSSAATLQTLKDMAQSLPKGDMEVTPVQAWFMLVEKYGTKLLVEEGRIERLRKALSELVDCFAFGAVMVEGKFWEVVKRTFVDVALREEREEVRDWI